MKVFKILLIFLFTNYVSINVNAQFIQIDDTYTAESLVKNVLINSPCANTSNWTVTGDLISGSEKSYAYFSAGISSFPFANGVVLSTARANRSAGPNDNLIDEGSTSWVGDQDLETAVGFNNTFNATVLEFDFVPLTNKISFDYLFASEEYQGTAPCRYSDAFAFLLKPVGSSIPYQNLAIIPGTNSPILVTSVHPLITAGNGCAAQNEAYFGSYNNVNAPINFNGQTVVLTAVANVIPGTNYHIKLVIADHENIRYDSAIFLAGGSFKIGTDLGKDKLISNKTAICDGEKFILDATLVGATYKWFKDNIQIVDSNTALPITSPTYEVSSSGTYKVEVRINASCTSNDEIEIEYTAKPILKNAILIQCDDDLDGKSIFNLKQLDDFIRSDSGNNPVLSPLNVVNYFEDPNATIPITNANASNYQNIVSNTQTIYAKVSNDFGCESIATITLKVSNNPINDQIINICDSDGIQDGKTTTNFDLKVTPVLVPFFPVGATTIKYYLTKNDAILQTNSILNLFTNTIPNQQIFYGRILNGSDCYGIVKIILNVLTFDKNLFQDEIKFICPNKTIKLEVQSGFSYVWSNGNITDNFINVSSNGIFTVKVTNQDNCSIIKTFDVRNSDSATINSIEVNDFNDNDNSILVNYSGIGNYEFSLDGINFQNNALFNNVAIGEYYITIRDKNKCNDVVSEIVYVLDFPKYFTPNNDGINDTWKINNLNKSALISIYNRFGKLLYQFDNNSNGWNGTLNQQLLQADDYWFTILLDNNRIIKNHFALKR
jgi:gliding motility-associated-like protein